MSALLDMLSAYMIITRVSWPLTLESGDAVQNKQQSLSQQISNFGSMPKTLDRMSSHF